MKQRKSIFLAAVVPFIFVLLLASCDNLVNPPSGERLPFAQEGKASVTFNISGGAGRTVLPDLSEINLEELSYTLTGTTGGTVKLDEELSSSGETFALEPGTWSFTLNALNTDDDIILTAVAEVTLAADKSNEVIFTLKPLKEGTGAINLSFTYPAHAGISKVTISGIASETETVDLSSKNGIWDYEAANVEADDYLAVFSFYRGADAAAVISETIQVRKGYTSKKTIGLSGINLNPGLFIKPEDVDPSADTLAEKLQWIKDNAVDNTNYLVEVTADEAIDHQYLEYSGKTGVSITLTGIGEERIISLTYAGSMFTVGSGVTLALENNITLKGREDNNSSLVWVGNGNLVLNNGAKITGNTATDGAGVSMNYGTLTMNGGEISGNTTTMYGGGGVYILNGTFTMNGGKISGNTSPLNAGGVYLYGGNWEYKGTFTMNGGEISGNTASSSGGGVYVSAGSYVNFIMNGGKISGNTASEGGGVLAGAFTMNEGEISGNTSTSGGGVYVTGSDNNSRQNFKMNGGKISGNTASSGGGVYVPSTYRYIYFSKTDGVIYGNNEIDTTLANNATAGRGHAVYWDTVPRFRDSTLGTGDNISTNDTSVNWELAVPEAPSLTNDWIPGLIEDVDGNQLFKFTASDATQYIHVKFGTLKYLYVQLYDKALESIGSSSQLYGSWTFKSLTGLSPGQTYYIRVSPDPERAGGDYEIMVSESPKLEETEAKALESGWNSSNLATYGYEWFTFNAVTESQSINVKFGGLISLNIEVYNSAWQQLGYTSGLSTNMGSTAFTSLSGLSSGQTYYIRVCPSAYMYSGTYEIAVNESPIQEETVPKDLENGWNPGNIEAEGEDWFKFTASSGSMYTHVKSGELTTIRVGVYNSAWQFVGTKSLAGLSIDETYYIKVWLYDSYNSGTYEIAVNESPITPDTAPKDIQSGWETGSTVAAGEDWFTFTASTESRYIHMKFGTLSDLYVQVYDSTWRSVEGPLNLYASRPRMSLTGLSAGQAYYIRVSPYDSYYSGDFKIAISGSETPPADSP